MSRSSYVFVLLLLLLAACGGGSPTSPTSTAPPIPNYAANWSGTYTISGCTQSGGVGLANICGQLGNQAPYTMSLTESGRSVTGTFALGTIQFGNTGGTIGSDGSLQLQGTSNSNGVTIIVNWQLNLNGSNALTGTLTQVWTSSTLSGQANVVGTITTATR